MAKLILRNGRNYGDISRYKDLLSKPTINTHLVEGNEATSSSLDIFKFIERQMYDGLKIKNPYTLYAVCDEDNNIRNYFLHGTKTYNFTDYYQVTELPEIGDPTVLYYLIQDTENYGKGAWFWLEKEPGIFEYTNIAAPDVDMKTVYIVPETGELITQVGGYIKDYEEIVEKTLIQNKNPISIEIFDDNYLMLKFNYDNFFKYTPATKYKTSLNYTGNVLESTFFPTDTFGTETCIFTEEDFSLLLPIGSYNSMNIEDYLLSLYWEEPQNISPINKIFIDIDEDSLEWENGVMHTDIVQNAYTSINELNEYLYSVFYNNMDYIGASKFINANPNICVLGGCATVHKGDLIGRNYDGYYDETVEFVVHTPERVGRRATIGFASSIPELTRETVGSGKYSDKYEILPFLITEGINDQGVVVTSHLIKKEKNVDDVISARVQSKYEINSNFVPRLLLDNCNSAMDAMLLLTNNTTVVLNKGLSNNGYIHAFTISDIANTYYIELIDSDYSVISNKNYFTNFYMYGTTPNTVTPPLYCYPGSGDANITNGITLHGQGIERLNAIDSTYSELTNRSAMFELLHNIKYEDIYVNDNCLTDWCWIDELKVNSAPDDFLNNPTVIDLKTRFTNRSRTPEDPNYGTWHTKHSSVYNSLLKNVVINIQGIEEITYKFSLVDEGLVLKSMMIDKLSNDITTLDVHQNSILQTIADCMFAEKKTIQINYANESYVFSSNEIYTDFWENKYFTLANNPDGLTEYRLIRVYIDEHYNVLGAREYDAFIAKFVPIAPNLGSFLPIHHFLGFKDSGYVTFSGKDMFKLSTKEGWLGNGTPQYSIDKNTWVDWDGVTPIEGVFQTNQKCEIYLRASGGTSLEGTNFTVEHTGMLPLDLSVKGKFESLVDCFVATGSASYIDYAFKNAFKDMTELVDASELSFPAAPLKGMYESCFENCTKLTKIAPFPENVGECGFKNTYKNTGLTESIEIPNLGTKGDYAFEGCFSDCKNLAIIKSLQSSDLSGKGCYKDLFANCISLIRIKEDILPSTTLVENCYEGMFRGCSSLETPPQLPALYLPTECYKEMFKDCISLEFGDEGNILRIPYFGTGVQASDACKDMFVGTSGDIPETTGTPLINKEYFLLEKNFYLVSSEAFTVKLSIADTSRSFWYSYDTNTWAEWDGSKIVPPKLSGEYKVYIKGTSGLGAIGTFILEGAPNSVDACGALGALTDNIIDDFTFKRLFRDATVLNSIEKLLFPIYGGESTYEEMFYKSGATGAPNINIINMVTSNSTGKAMFKNMFAYSLIIKQPSIHVPIFTESMFENCFNSCSKLEEISKIDADDDTIKVKVFRAMYGSCPLIIITPDLDYSPYNNSIPEEAFMGMFSGCTGLTTFTKFIDCEKVEIRGCSQMFDGCTSLISIPSILTPIQVDQEGYYNMFAKCAISSTPELPATILGTSCYQGMFINSKVRTMCELPATELATKCYNSMFSNSHLTHPCLILPAQEVKNGSYEYMFNLCFLLESFPKINATKCGYEGMRGMFRMCNKAAGEVELLLTEIEGYACESMFEQTKITKCSDLLPTHVPMNGYSAMFSHSAIQECPKIYATSGDVRSFMYMFYECQEITEPAKIYVEDLSPSEICAQMFAYCKGIVWGSMLPYKVPYVVPTYLDNENCKNMFLANTIKDTSEMPSSGTPIINKVYYLDAPPTKWITIEAINTGDSFKLKGIDTIMYSIDQKHWYNLSGGSYTPSTEKIYIAGYIPKNTYPNHPFDIEFNSPTHGNTKVYGELEGLDMKDEHHFEYAFMDQPISNISGLTFVENGAYQHCFDGCPIESLEEVELPILPPDTTPELYLDFCYAYMFARTNITSIPYSFLPSTNLWNACYLGMFYQCTKLENANVALPATNMKVSCYSQMFEGCTSLTVIPTIKGVQTLDEGCFNRMFRQCTRLITLPTDFELSTPETAVECYSSMFAQCSRLKTCVDRLPAQHVAEKAYAYMFQECSALTECCDIYGYILDNQACLNMFARTAVSQPVAFGNGVAPSWGDVASNALTSMFYQCSNIIWAEYGREYTIFESGVTEDFGVTCSTMFYGNTRLSGTNMPANGSANTETVYYLDGPPVDYLTYINTTPLEPYTLTMKAGSKFSYDTINWTSVPAGSSEATYTITASTLYLFINENAKTNGNARIKVLGNLKGFRQGNTPYIGAFTTDKCIYDASELEFNEIGNRKVSYCFSQTNLIYPPKKIILPSEPIVNTCEGMFQGCNYLISAPELPATSVCKKGYFSMFRGCNSLLNAPVLPATIVRESGYEEMFWGCTALETPPTLPCMSIGPYCYKHMFADCTSLTKCPELPSISLEAGCYSYMFNACTSIKEPCQLPAKYLPTECYMSMFSETGIIWGPVGTPYRIPTAGTGSYGSSTATAQMFYTCTRLPGTLMPSNGQPALNTVYYYDVEPTDWLTYESMDGSPYTITMTAGTKWRQTGTEEWNTVTMTGDSIKTASKLDVYAYGNCRTTNTSGEHPNVKVSGTWKGFNNSMGSNEAQAVFANDRCIVDASDLILEDCKAPLTNLFNGATALKYPPRKITIDPTFINPDSEGRDVNDCYGMFKNCTSLTTTPELPMTDLSQRRNVYAYMFTGCTSLTSAPVLPATKLGYGTYNNMFARCSNLISTHPTVEIDIEGSEVMNMTYTQMYYGCSKLTTTMEYLQSSGSGSMTFQSMFEACRSLENCPELRGNTIGEQACYKMYALCDALKETCELPATNLNRNCYAYMFQDCSTLNKPAKLPATTIPYGAYIGMFQGCSGIIWSPTGTPYRIPDGAATGTMSSDSLNQMFESNIVLSGSEMPTSGTPEINKTYYIDVEPTSWLTYTMDVAGSENYGEPYYLTMNAGSKYSYDEINWTPVLTNDTRILVSAQKIYVFAYGRVKTSDSNNRLGLSGSYKGFVNLPEYGGGHYEGVFYEDECVYDASGLNLKNSTQSLEKLFYGSNVQIAPQTISLIGDNINCQAMFSNCKKLRVPPELPMTNLNESMYSDMFFNCESLQVAPTLPATTLARYCYFNMFARTSITRTPDMGEGNNFIAAYCSCAAMFDSCTKLTETMDSVSFGGASGQLGAYSGMFAYCTSLEKAPAIIGTFIPDNGCECMFQGCTSLKQCPELPATSLGRYAYSDMFSDCTSINSPCALPCQQLNYWCYLRMFKNCTNIIWEPTGNDYRIPSAGVTLDAGYQPTLNMFEGTTIMSGSDMPSTGTAALDHTYYYGGKIENYLTFTNGMMPQTYHLELGVGSKYSYDKENWVVVQGSNADIEVTTENIYVYAYGRARAYDPNYINKYVRVSGDSKGFKNLGSATTNGVFSESWSLSSAALLNLENCSQTLDQLFSHSQNLIYPPKKITTLGASDTTCQHMFTLCGSLIEAPELPMTKLSNAMYACMFYCCSALTEAPVLPATNLSDNCYSHMFSECTSLLKTPVMGDATTGFTPAYMCCDSMFSGCTNLKETMKSLRFSEDTSLTSKEHAAYWYMFENCTNLEVGPEKITGAIAGQGCKCMFKGCTSLKATPELPATYIREQGYESMFEDCKSLKAPAVLPALALVERCYYRMFCGCSSITWKSSGVAYRIPAEGTHQYGTNQCVTNMFYGNNYISGSSPSTPNYEYKYYYDPT